MSVSKQPKGLRYETGPVERFNYSLFFLGQGMCYILVYSFLQQHSLDNNVPIL